MVAGGFNERGALRSAELWDPASGKWECLPDMTHARCGAAAILLRGGFAVVGGVGTDNRKRRDGELYDLVNRAWLPLPEMATARSAQAAMPVAGGMIVAGGCSGDLDADIEYFDELTWRWHTCS